MENLNKKAVCKLILEGSAALLAIMIGGISIASFALSLYSKNAKFAIPGVIIVALCWGATMWLTNRIGETIKKELLYAGQAGDEEDRHFE